MKQRQKNGIDPLCIHSTHLGRCGWGRLSLMVATCALLGTGSALAQTVPGPVVGPEGAVPTTPPGGEENAPTPPEKPVTRRADLSGPSYTIYQFLPDYVRPNPGLPEIEVIEKRVFPLGFVQGRWVSPALAKDYGGEVVMVSVENLNLGENLQVGDYDATRVFHYTALDAILEEVRLAINEKGIIGVRTIPEPADITIQGEDLRSSASDPVGILILTAEVTSTRTIASGDRFPMSERVDNPKHAKIALDAPLQVTPEGAEVQNPDSLLRRDELDRYLFQLNRHPGRRVDVALSALDEPGTTQLDYLVNENKTWSVYYQLTNTGTDTTGNLRHRLGYVNNQLTNSDDSLNLDYIFSDIQDPGAMAAVIGYERPLFSPRVRGRIQGLYTEYDARELGQAQEDFQGYTGSLDANVAWNFHQKKNFFLDAIFGVETRYIRVENKNAGSTPAADELFVTPYLGLAAERITDTDRLLADVRLTADFDFTGHDTDSTGDFTRLGRTNADETWVVFKYSGYYATYLEPLLNRAAWEDPSTPESSTLAHEMILRLSGQYSFGNRLVPQYEAVTGGLYSVRGYPESVVAGDDSIFMSAEYRYHVPRDFAVDRTPDHTLFGEPFRVSPQEVYSQPDWDLTLKAFADFGATFVSNAYSNIQEEDETLLGVGVGAGLLLKQNISADVDFGYALLDAREDTRNEVESGDSRVHFSLTILY